MTSLWYLQLFSNSLNGTLPATWGSLSSMSDLELHWNSFSGPLPPEWSSMTKLEILSLHYNSLSGALPVQWGNMTRLRYLQLHSNFLDGPLPAQWSSMANMHTLRLYNNSLSGTLPAQWGNITTLEILSLNNNFLTGTLPFEWSGLSASLMCSVIDNCLNTSNAAPWWLQINFRQTSPQRTAGCATRSGSASIATSPTESQSRMKSYSLTLQSVAQDSMTFTTLTLLPNVRNQLIAVPSTAGVAAKNVGAVLIIAPMVFGGGFTFGAPTVQLGVASSLLSRRRQRADIDGIGSSILENPLQIRLSTLSPTLQTTGGTVIGNVVVCLVVVMCSALVSHVTEHGRRQCDVMSVWRAVRGYFVERLPGALLSPLGLLLEPTLSASFSLLISPNRTAGSCVLGAVGAMVLVGGLIWTTVVVGAGLLDGLVAYKEGRASGNCWCHAIPRGRWVVSTESLTDRLFFERFSPFFIENLGSRSMFFAFDLWSTVAVAFVAAIGLSLDDDGVVAPAGDVLCGIALLRLLCVAVLRPLSVAPCNAFAALLEALSVVCTLLGCLDSGDKTEQVALWVTVVQTCLTGITALERVSITALYAACRRRLIRKLSATVSDDLNSPVGIALLLKGPPNHVATAVCEAKVTMADCCKAADVKGTPQLPSTARRVAKPSAVWRDIALRDLVLRICQRDDRSCCIEDRR